MFNTETVKGIVERVCTPSSHADTAEQFAFANHLTNQEVALALAVAGEAKRYMIPVGATLIGG